MQIVQQILFGLLTFSAVLIFYRRISRIRNNFKLGREEVIGDQKWRRWKNVLLLAFGQKKMFRNPLVGVLHFFVYAGFIIINIEVLEIIADGLAGTHRLFSGVLGKLYPILINAFEVLAVIVILFCAIFLIRRNILKVKRLASKELDGWPRSDANFILIAEIILMTLFLTMNASDTLLYTRNPSFYNYHHSENFIVSRHLHAQLASLSDVTLMGIERGSWWLHVAGIFAFLNYLPYSKHLHILLAFPNAYYAGLESPGKMKNMVAVQNEVQYILQPDLTPGSSEHPGRFGAKDIGDLSWKNLLDAFSCTECGRCTAACPANQTGKKLSPRKIMMDTRDRTEEISRAMKADKALKEDGKTLLFDYITPEELRACTTCNACVQECPVSINPLDIILQLRRYLVMEESNAPQEWNAMFSNIENNFAPWKFSPDDRDSWMRE
jgi:heterodisulfide reductase subunit C